MENKSNLLGVALLAFVSSAHASDVPYTVGDLDDAVQATIVLKAKTELAKQQAELRAAQGVTTDRHVQAAPIQTTALPAVQWRRFVNGAWEASFVTETGAQIARRGDTLKSGDTVSLINSEGAWVRRDGVQVKLNFAR